MVQQLAIVSRVSIVSSTRSNWEAFLTNPAGWKPWQLPTARLQDSGLRIEREEDDWYLLASDGRGWAFSTKGACTSSSAIFLGGPLPSRVDLDALPEVLGRTIWSGVAAPGAHLPATAEGLAALQEGARRLRASTDRAIVGLFGGNMFELPQWLFRMDHYLMSLAAEPEACLRLSERSARYTWQGSRHGSAPSPVYRRDPLRRRPRRPERAADLPRRTGAVSAVSSATVPPRQGLAGVKVRCTAAAVGAALGDLIDAGLDAINPVQITCRGMAPEHLKQAYGDRLAFWGGGCDTRRVLAHGTPAEVRDNVRRLVGVFAPGGGFVFQQVHNILADVPPENVAAMFDAVRAD